MSAIISLSDASSMTLAFQQANPAETKAWKVDNESIYAILSQNKCRSIRVYNALKDDGSKTIVLVGVTADNADILSGVIVDEAADCPEDCPQAGLNHAITT